jgi:UDP-glucose 4-epimerase
MKCAVFGGGGFIGSAVCDRLLKEGHALRIFERPKVPPYRVFGSGEKVDWIEGDMLSTRDLDQCLKGVNAVFHLVSTTFPKNSNENPIYDVESNLVGSLRLLDSMVRNAVPRIVFISSGGTVYGVPEYLPIDERHPTNPRVSYGITKLAIEKYLHLYSGLYGIRPVILRVSNPFGARQRLESAQGAATAFLRRALNEDQVEIWGDGTVTRDYLHVNDVAEAFLKALTYEGEKSVFNIGSGEGTSLNQLLETIERNVGRPVRRAYLHARSFDVSSSILCNDLARQELGWIPTISLEEGISITAHEIVTQRGL